MTVYFSLIIHSLNLTCFLFIFNFGNGVDFLYVSYSMIFAFKNG